MKSKAQLLNIALLTFSLRGNYWLQNMSYSEIINSDLGNQCNIIYKFENITDGKIYIGQTRKKFRERLAQHIWQTKNNPSYFHKAINKYGIANFEIDILETVNDPDLLNGLEIYWIDYYKSNDRNKGYNLTKGGSGEHNKKSNYHYVEKDSSRLKRSKSAKQKWKSEEYRNRYIQSRKEYKKVEQLDKNFNSIKIFNSINDAERYIFGKKNGKLWWLLCKKQIPEVEFNNCIWRLY